MTTEFVILVDESDQMVGTEEKIKAHQKGLLHRAFSVFVYRIQNGVAEILLQKRHPDKYHCGGLWSNTCCSHPREGEETKGAAERRLREELSIEMPLKWVGAFQYQAPFPNGLIEHEYDHVFVGKFNPNPNPNLNPNLNLNFLQIDPLEISDIRWISVPELQSELQQNPNAYTPWLSPAFNILLEAECLK